MLWRDKVSEMKKPYLYLLWLAVFVILVITLVVLSLSIRLGSEIDPAPVHSTSSLPALGPGQVWVSFELETCCDQFSFRGWQTGLRFVVHYANSFEQQLFASCDQAGIDGSFNGSPLSEVEAVCDGKTYQITTDLKEIRLEETSKGAKNIITRVQLPADTNSVLYVADLPVEGR